MHLPDRFQFFLNRLSERLWVKPAIACVLSIAGVWLGHVADDITIDWEIPEIAQGSIVDLLKIIAASMLGVATFAVASMVAAYASTDKSATARAFPLVVADDVSQNALSVFVGTFIFSIVALSATTNDYFGKAGRFTLFALTLLALAIVVLVFVRWVDSIARLGRLGAVVAKVEHAASAALDRRRRRPFMGGLAATGPPRGLALHSEKIGYLQRVDMAKLQDIASGNKLRITLAGMPGTMVMPSRPLCYVWPDSEDGGVLDPEPLRSAFVIGPVRRFDDDPRFGLIVLTEIACRALSPGINDPGTAIGILGSLQRLFQGFASQDEPEAPEYDRIEAPCLQMQDMFDDVFTPISRDGASVIEVSLRVQRVLGELAQAGHAQMRAVAGQHADLALGRAECDGAFPADLALLRQRHADYWASAAACAKSGPTARLAGGCAGTDHWS
jgi:uncharacterized membrane protein